LVHDAQEEVIHFGGLRIEKQFLELNLKPKGTRTATGAKSTRQASKWHSLFFQTTVQR